MKPKTIETYTTTSPMTHRMEVITQTYHIPHNKDLKYAAFTIYTDTLYNHKEQSESDVNFSDSKALLGALQARFTKQDSTAALQPIIFSGLSPYKINDLEAGTLPSGLSTMTDDEKNKSRLAYVTILAVDHFKGNSADDNALTYNVFPVGSAGESVTHHYHNIDAGEYIGAQDKNGAEIKFFQILRSKEESYQDAIDNMETRSEEGESNNLLLYILIGVLVVLCIVMLVLLSKK